ncbi:MAG: helix-turn-helix domain-containing protein [Oscillospiraceae bacterium]|nr:helix-turn-helix domain-containing protein [Oscillospiraceae bacterium]
MELGEKLKAARLAAGLSQRQLCGDVITRNMLSQIENGSARPSMDTLRYLAGQLGKPVSFFLEEAAVSPPHQAATEAARRAYLAGEYEAALRALETCGVPEGTFEQECRLLTALACLSLAEEAADRGQKPYAAELLARAEQARPAYCARELERRRLLLAAKLHPQPGQEIVRQLPSLDEELLLRARAALDAGDIRRCAALLEAAEDRESPDWNFLRGEAFLAEGDYARAAECYHRAEEAHPKKTAPRLERCYRELEDYKQAYFYACKQR